MDEFTTDLLKSNELFWYISDFVRAVVRAETASAHMIKQIWKYDLKKPLSIGAY